MLNSRRLSRFAAAIAAVLLSVPGPGEWQLRGDEPVPLPPGESDAQLTPRRLIKVYENATRLLEQGETSQGLSLLQLILDHPSDDMIPPDADRSSARIGLKSLVWDTLGNLSTRQRDTYDLLFGEQAKDVLRAADRPERLKLQEVTRRFYFTNVGFEAALRLGSLYFDWTDYSSAADEFKRLLNDRRLKATDRPRLLFQAALACRLANEPENALSFLKQLKRISGDGALNIGGKTVSLFERDSEAVAWLDRFAAGNLYGVQRDLALEWPTFRGDSARNAAAAPALPLREQDWTYRTVPISDMDSPRKMELVEADLDALYRQLAPNDYLLLPAANPLVVNGLIVLRSLGNIKAIDLDSGEMVWESLVIDRGFRNLLKQFDENASTIDSRITPLRRYMLQRSWKDLACGTLSCDGRYVYSIEEQGVVFPDQIARYRGRGNESFDHNSLMAFELKSGKYEWELGGPREETRLPLAGAVFLGPPLVQDRNLFVLAQLDGEVNLISLVVQETQHGEVEPQIAWSQPLPLSPGSEELGLGHSLRMSGLTPSFSSGMLICPTGHGAVVAFDLTRRLFRWRYQYDHPLIFPHNVRNMLNQLDADYGLSPDDQDRWVDSVPVIASGRVLLTPDDSTELHCINLSDGRLQWKNPRGQDLYLACVQDEEVVLVGRNGVRACSLADGRELWRIALPPPSGRGALVGKHYFVPLSSAAVAAVDLERGRLLGISPSEHHHIPGNLVAGEGFLVSQTHNLVYRYRSFDELQAMLTRSPGSSESVELEAEWQLLDEGPTAALPLLERAWAEGPSARLKSVFTRALLAGLETDFERFAAQKDRLAELTRNTPERAEFKQVYVSGLVRSGRTREAFSELLNQAADKRQYLARHNENVRSDRWAQAQLLELYRNAPPEEQAALRRLVRARWDQVGHSADARLQARLVEFFEPLPGMEALRLQEVRRLDPYTQSLEFELALMSLHENSHTAEALEARAAHFRLLMKLEHVEQAEILRQALLTEPPDRRLADGETVGHLVAWGLENEKLASWRKTLDHKWPRGAVEVREEPSPNQSFLGGETAIPVTNAPGLFRYWSFYFNPQYKRLTVYDSLGRNRGEWNLTGHSGRSTDLQFDREVLLYGHLAVVRFSDSFYVLDLLGGGQAPTLLHGPHDLSRPFPGMMDNQRLMLHSESGRLPNGRLVIRMFDMFHRPFGRVEIAGGNIVFQRDSRLIAIDAIGGEELWNRRISGFGRPLCGSAAYLSAVSVEDESIDVFRTLDGSLLHRVAVPGLTEVLGRVGHTPIVTTATGQRLQVQRFDPVARQAVWSVECSADALFQMVDSTDVAVCEPGHRVRLIRGDSGEVACDESIPSDRQLLAFQAVPLRDGLIVALQEIPQGRRDVSFRPMATAEYPLVDGPVLKVGTNGKKLWERSVSEQGFNPWQAADSPAMIFLSRRMLSGRNPSRPESQAAWEIFDVATGKTLGSSGDEKLTRGIPPMSDLTPVVHPEQSEVEFVGQRTVFKVEYRER